MAMKLSTTLQHLNIIPHSVNAKVVKEFYEYLKMIGTSENYQNQNLKQIIGFAFLGRKKTFYDIKLREEILLFLNTKMKDIQVDPDKKWITTWNDYLWRVWVVLFANFYWGWIIGMSLLGIGTALVHPTLLASISDVANPKWRATSLGVYRFWRDLGFVFGAIGIGFLADIFGLDIAFYLVAFLGIVSGIFVLTVMKETSRQR